MKGNVKFFNSMKGFGFIKGEDGNEYFVHQTGLNDGVTLNENDAVEFEVEQGERGPKAVKVGPATEAAEEPVEESSEEDSEEGSEEGTEE